MIKKQSVGAETDRTKESNTLDGLKDKSDDTKNTIIELSKNKDTDEPPPQDTRSPTQRMLDDARLELEDILNTYSTKKEKSSSRGAEDAEGNNEEEDAEGNIELFEIGDTVDPPTPPKDNRCPTQRMLDDARLELEEILYATKKDNSLS